MRPPPRRAAYPVSKVNITFFIKEDPGMKKRTLSALLAVIMVFGIIPFYAMPVFADSRIGLSGDKYNGVVGETLQFWIDFYADGIPEDFVCTVDDDSVASAYYSDYNVYVTLVGEGSTTVTIRNSASDAASCDVSALPVTDLVLGTDADVIIDDAHRERYFRFVAPSAGEYVFFSEGDYDTYGYLLSDAFSELTGDDDGGTNGNFKMGYTLVEGQVCYVKARLYNYDGGEHTFTLKCEKKPAAEAIELSYSEISGYVNDSRRVDVNFLPEGSGSEEVEWSIDDDNVARLDYTSGSYNYIRFVSTGEATVTATSANGLTATCKVTVTEPKTLVENVPMTMNIEDNHEQKLVFTPSESGYYVFGISGRSNENVPRIVAYCYDDNDWYYFDEGYSFYDSDTVSWALAAGREYSISTAFDWCVDGEDGSFTLTAAKAVDPTGITLSETSIEDLVHTSHELKYTIEPWNNNVDSVTWTTSDDTVATVNDGHVEFVGVGTATITASANGLDATCAVTVNDYEQIALGETKQATIPKAYGSAYFKFVPGEDGYYGFCSYDNSDGIWKQAAIRDYQTFDTIDCRSTYDDYGNFSLVCKMTAGSAYVLEAKYDWDSCTEPFNVTAFKCPALEAITLSREEMTGYPSGNTSYRISVTYSPSDAAPEQITWTSSDESIATLDRTTGSYAYVTYVAPGEATITATSESGATATCKVTVKVPLTLEENVPQTITIEDNDAKKLVFTPSETGNYVFRISDRSNVNEPYVSIRCYDDNDWYYFDGSFVCRDRETVSWNLEAGREYEVWTAFDWYAESDGTYVLTAAKAVAPTGIELSETSIEDRINTEHELKCSVFPWNAESSAVTWTTSDDTVATVSDGRVRLVGVGEATITASMAGLDAACAVTVKDYDPIAVGETKQAVIPEAYGIAYFKFVPEEDGYYAFYSSDNAKPTYGMILDYGDMNVLASDSYSGGNGNFLIKYKLTAGTAYLLAAQYDWYSTTEPFNVTLDKCPALEAIRLSWDEITDYVGASSWHFSVIYDPNGAAPEPITWTSSDESVARMNYSSGSDNYISFVAPGEATITATSESGLTATCKVTVLAPLTLEENVPLTVNVERNKAPTLVFTPSESGKYVFRVSDRAAECDIYINFYCYDESDNYYFDNGYYFNSRDTVSLNLEAGREYRIKTEYEGYNSTGSGSFVATVAKAVTPASITLDNDSLENYVFTSHELNFTLAPWNADRSAVTWTTSDDTVATVSDGYVNFVGVGTATITASAGGLDATCAVTVKDFEPIALDETKTAQIKNRYDMAYYKFTPDADATYVFYAPSSSSSSYGYIYDDGLNWLANDNNCSYDGRNFKIAYEMRAGTTYVLGARLSDSATGAVTVRITKATAAESMTLNRREITGYADGESYYIDVSFAPFNAMPEKITWTSGDKSVATVSEYGDVTLVAPGETTVTATSEGGLTATCKVTVLAPGVLVENEPATVTIENNFRRLYVFTPSESGKYAIGVSDISNTNVPRTFIYNPYSEIEGSGTMICDLTAGREYRIHTDFSSYTSPGNGTYVLTVAKAVTPTSITLSEESIEGYPEDGYSLSYTLEPWNSDTSAVKWSSSDESVVTVDSYGNITLAAPGEATVTASVGELSATCAVTVNAPTPLVLGETTAVNIVNNREKRFVFTPEESGNYMLRVSDRPEFNDPYVRLYNNERSFTIYDEGTRLCELEAGKTYYLNAYFHSFSGDGSGSFTVTLSKAVAPTSITFETTEYETFEGMAYYLYYSLEPWNADYNSIIWTSSDETVATVSDGRVSFVGAGSATVTASAGDASAACKFTVKAAEVLTENEPLTVNITDYGTKMLVFTPDADGTYVFRVSDRFGEATPYLYFVNDNDYSFGLRETIILELNAGQKYYVNAHLGNNGNGSFSVTVSKAVPPTAISFASDTVEHSVYSQFTLSPVLAPWNAVASGYVWTSSDNSVATVDENGLVTLVGVGEATVTVSKGELSATCLVKSVDCETIAAGETKTAVISEGGACVYYKFTPSESGEYVFYSTSDKDTYGYVFDFYRNTLISDDDSGANSNFYIRFNMTAGTTYVLGARLYNSERTGEFPVTLAKLVPAEGLTVVPTISGYVGTYDFIDAEFTPYNAIPENITYTSDNEAVATVDEDGVVRLRSVGEAIITATSESGHTATCKVTVIEPAVLTLDSPVSGTVDSLTEFRATFVAEQNGSYRFALSDTNQSEYVYMYLENEQGSTIGFISDIVSEAELTAGSKCTVVVFNRSTQSTPFTLTASKLIKATGMTVTPEVSGYAGAYRFVEATFTPANAATETVTWTSSNESVATVNRWGEVYLLAAGEATITATSESGLTATCKVKVFEPAALALDTPVSGTVSFGDPKRFTFTASESGTYRFALSGEGEYVGLQAYINMPGAVTGPVKFQDVTLPAGGTCNVSVYTYADEANAPFTVTASKVVTATGIAFEVGDSYEALVGESRYMDVVAVPWNGEIGEVEWSTSDPSVAKVYGSGFTEFVGVGTAVLTAKAGDFTATCTVTVKEQSTEPPRGDFNNDGVTNARDIITLMRYLTSWVDEGVIVSALDYNRDGKVNVRDVFDLMKDIVRN